MTDQRITHTERVRLLFDTKAPTWPAKYGPEGRHASRLARFASAATHHVPVAGKLLDLGCGTGELARHITDAGWRVTGCDISAEMLRCAAATEPRNTVDWVQLAPDWTMLPFESMTFDVVFVSSVLEYVRSPGVVLSECARVLRPGGFVICTVPDIRHPVRWAEWPARAIARSPLGHLTSRHWPRLECYLTYLRLSGQRRSAHWWSRLAAQNGLHYPAPHPHQFHPLLLLIFQRPKLNGIGVA